MERESNSMQTLCRSGCGFYGNPATDGLCSLCYKEALKKKQQLPSTTPSLSALRDTATGHTTINSAASSATSSAASSMSALISSHSQSLANIDLPSLMGVADDIGNGGSVVEEKILGGPTASSNLPTIPQPSGTLCDINPGCPSSSQELPDFDSSGIASATASDDKDSKKKKNRCAVCRKKVGLTGFECRCGGLFCAIHRYSDKHDCNFNYREMGAQEIRRNNPVVVGEKIQKI